MTLERRLQISLLSLTLLAILLLGLSTNYVIQNRFEQYVLHYQEQRLNHWIQLLENYYTENGSWQGIEALVAPHGMKRGMNGTGMGMGMSMGKRGNLVTKQELDMLRTENGERVVLSRPDGTIILDTWYEELGNQVHFPAQYPHQALWSDQNLIGTVWLDPQPLPGIESLEEEFSQSVRWIFLGAGLLILAMAIILARLLARRLTKPLYELMTATEQIAAGKRDSHVLVETKDELGALANQFNHMVAEIDRAEQQQREMIANVAHDLRTPIAILRGNLESMLAGIVPTNEERLVYLYDEVHRMSYLVQELHDLSLAEARQLQLNKEWIPLHPFLQRIHHVFTPETEQRHINFSLRAPASTEESLYADPRRLEQVMYNLMANALRYTPDGGEIILAWEPRQDKIVIRLLDSGPGIAPEDLPHLFERFYRGDKARNRTSGGSGLGLAIVKELIQLHDGEIQVANRPEGGCCFTIHLPRHSNHPDFEA